MQLHILLLTFFFTCLNGEANNSVPLRHKRALLDLAGVMKCATGRSALLYVGYGCYCGIGGKGTPKDQADWCCHQHDCCYGVVGNAGCRPKAEAYNWNCVHSKYIRCDVHMSKCQRMMCDCDKKFAECLRGAPYNKKYVGFPNFLCSKQNPDCSYMKDQASYKFKYKRLRLDE